MSLYHYYYEIWFKCFYVFFSYFLCFLIGYFFLNILFIHISYPLIELNCFQKFISLELSEYLTCSLKILINTSLLFIVPFVFLIVFFFFTSSWYKFQLFDFKINLFIITLLQITIIFFNYNLFLPISISFFLIFRLRMFFLF